MVKSCGMRTWLEAGDLPTEVLLGSSGRDQNGFQFLPLALWSAGLITSAKGSVGFLQVADAMWGTSREGLRVVQVEASGFSLVVPP
jgi:hypothetical protein